MSIERERESKILIAAETMPLAKLCPLNCDEKEKIARNQEHLQTVKNPLAVAACWMIDALIVNYP